MPYKLLALDLDNTLLNPDLTISPETLNALQDLISKGIYVTLSTGRMFPSARKYAEEIGIKIPLVTYNGALIRGTDGSFPEILRPLPAQKRDAIIDFCHTRGYYVQLYNNDTLICEKYLPETAIDPDLLNCPYKEVGDFRTAKLTDTPKMLMVADPADVPRITEELKSEVGLDLYIAASKSNLIEIMRQDVSKSSALALLCDELNILPAEVVCCGDNSNDAAMVAWAGMGVAMSNAVPELKAIAKYTCQNSYSAGVYEAICKFF